MIHGKFENHADIPEWWIIELKTGTKFIVPWVHPDGSTTLIQHLSIIRQNNYGGANIVEWHQVFINVSEIAAFYPQDSDMDSLLRKLS